MVQPTGENNTFYISNLIDKYAFYLEYEKNASPKTLENYMLWLNRFWIMWEISISENYIECSFWITESRYISNDYTKRLSTIILLRLELFSNFVSKMI